MANRVGAILAVRDVPASIAFYRDVVGFTLEAEFDDPPYATLSLAGARLSLAEQGYESRDRPGVAMTATTDPSNAAVVLVVEVDDARAEYARMRAAGVPLLAEPFAPPWGGCRYFCSDPDGYLVEIEEVA